MNYLVLVKAPATGGSPRPLGITYKLVFEHLTLSDWASAAEVWEVPESLSEMTFGEILVVHEHSPFVKLKRPKGGIAG